MIVVQNVLERLVLESNPCFKVIRVYNCWLNELYLLAQCWNLVFFEKLRNFLEIVVDCSTAKCIDRNHFPENQKQNYKAKANIYARRRLNETAYGNNLGGGVKAID